MLMLFAGLGLGVVVGWVVGVLMFYHVAETEGWRFPKRRYP